MMREAEQEDVDIEKEEENDDIGIEDENIEEDVKRTIILISRKMNYIEDGELKEQEDNDFENDI